MWYDSMSRMLPALDLVFRDERSEQRVLEDAVGGVGAVRGTEKVG